jgi:hypothetical protein
LGLLRLLCLRLRLLRLRLTGERLHARQNRVGERFEKDGAIEAKVQQENLREVQRIVAVKHLDAPGAPVANVDHNPNHGRLIHGGRGRGCARTRASARASAGCDGRRSRAAVGEASRRDNGQREEARTALLQTRSVGGGSTRGSTRGRGRCRCRGGSGLICRRSAR